MDRMNARWVHRLLALLLAVGSASAAQADDDQDVLRQKALALNDVTGEDPINAEVRQLVKDKVQTKKLLEVALKMAGEKDQPFSYNASCILGRTAARLKIYKTAEKFFRICSEQADKLQSESKYRDSHEGLADVLYQTRRYAECEKLCKNWLESQYKDGQVVAYEFLIQALAKQAKFDDARRLVDRLGKLDPESLLFIELKTLVDYEAGKYEDAAKGYEEALKIVRKNRDLAGTDKSKLEERYEYLLSSVWIEARNVDKATEYLKKLVDSKPENPTYNNDLGYVMADNDRNLDEAEKLIRKAIEEDRKKRKSNPELSKDEDKDVAAYLDSLGWVLFKKKQFQEAKKFLVEAIKDEEGQHIEIYDHLGDVHMALGEKDAAIKIWKKALDVEPGTKREKDRKVKIEEKVKVASK